MSAKDRREELVVKIRSSPANRDTVSDTSAAELDRLVRAAVSGDDAAFRALFDATYRDLRLFVAARARSQEMVDEVVQGAYVRAFEQLAVYRAGGTFVAWIKGIARNLLLQEFERRTRLAPLAEQPAPLADPLVEDLGERLTLCLDELSPTARTLMELRYHDHISVQEIAVRLGRSASSVSVSLFRLRNALATCLGSGVTGHG